MYFIKYGKICTALHLFTHAVVTADCRCCWVLITWQYWIFNFVAKVWKDVYVRKEDHHLYEQKVFYFENIDPGGGVSLQQLLPFFSLYRRKSSFQDNLISHVPLWSSWYWCALMLCSSDTNCSSYRLLQN